MFKAADVRLCCTNCFDLSLYLCSSFHKLLLFIRTLMFSLKFELWTQYKFFIYFYQANFRQIYLLLNPYFDIHLMQRLQRDFEDFIIRVGKHEYHCKRKILSKSEYFKTLLADGTKESLHREIELKDVDSECVKVCLHFMKFGSFHIPKGKECDLLYASNLMRLEKLNDRIADVLGQSLTAENFSFTREVAITYGLKSLLDRCRHFESRNIRAIAKQPSFKNDSKTRIVDILAKNYSLTEVEKLTMLQKWLEIDHSRKYDFLDLLKLVDFIKISRKHLRHLLRNDPLISNDFDLYKAINLNLLSNPFSDSHTSCRGVKFVIFEDSRRSCVNIYDILKDELVIREQGRNLPSANFSAFSAGYHVYLLCPNRNVYRININEMAGWSKLPSMNYNHGSLPRAASVSGKLYVIGSGEGEPSSVIEEFNPNTHRWITLSDKPQSVSDMALVSSNDSIYCFGGKTNMVKHSSNVCKFTPWSSEWVDLPPMKNDSETCRAAALQHKIIVISNNRVCEVNYVDCFDTRTLEWTSLAPLPEFYDYGFTFHIDGTIYAGGRFMEFNKMMQYDVEEDRWEKVKLKTPENLDIYDCLCICRE